MRYEIQNGFVLGPAEGEIDKELCIPEGVTGIGQRAFAGAPIEKLTVPEGLRKIEAGAFSGCAALRELDLPATVQSLSSGAFERCTGLTRARFSEKMPVYGEQLFFGCTALRRVEGLESGSAAEYFPKEALLRLTLRGGEEGTVLAGVFVDSALLRSGTLLEVLDGDGARRWALWLPVGEQSQELKEKLRDLLYSPGAFRFNACDELFRSMKEEKNKLLYALLRLLTPVELSGEVEIMLRNLLRRGATPCAAFLVEDGRLELLEEAVRKGLLDRARPEELLPIAEGKGCAERVRALFAEKAAPAEAEGVETLTPGQIKMLNSPVYARLMERKEKLRRASLERLAKNGESLEQLLREGVRADDRAKVRYYLASSQVEHAVLFDCAMLAVDNGDVYMLQDLIEAAHGLEPLETGLLLEHAAIGGRTAVVRALCAFLPSVIPYHRALGYAMRQADFDMVSAILSRGDQKLLTAKEIRDEYVRRMNKPELKELDRRIVDLGYIDYNYYDDDFRYMLLNTNRNGLIGDEFYETHCSLVKLASAEQRIALIRRMKEAGWFGPRELSYLCYLATDADEIAIAQALVEMGAPDFDVKACSILANQQTVLEELGDMFTSNPHRPSDEKFAFILSRLKPGEKMKMQVKYLLKTANVGRALAILKHSSLENVEDVPMTIDYFVRHNSLEAIELFCQWGKADDCFEAARSLENTEIVAWILNYQNQHGGKADTRDRFEI